MRIVPTIIVAAVLAASGSASAQTIGFNGADEIARGDFARAEQVIDKSRKMFPDYPEMLLNLAVVYRHTGRPEQARILYQQVLRQPDETLDVRREDVAASSHAVATAALARLGERLASR